MCKSISRLFFIILLSFIFLFSINSVKAVNWQEVAKITPTICDSEAQTGNYIPTGGASEGYDNKAFFGNSFDGIYYCVSNSDDSHGAGFRYFKLNPNPTKKIFFPVIYWDWKNNSQKYSDNSALVFSDAYATYLDAYKKYPEEKQKIFENISRADKSYAKGECDKYCNTCHATKDGYAYYCNDYELKKNYYTFSPLNFQGEGETWSNFGWQIWYGITVQWPKIVNLLELFDDTMTECLKPENDYCKGKILYIDDETLNKNVYTLKSGKKCWNYVTNSGFIATGSETIKPGSVDLGDRYWVCEVLSDCQASCLGKCISPKDFSEQTHSYMGALKSDINAYYCLGSKDRNTKFLNGDSTEDKKYFTSDYDEISSMLKYDGDNISATLQNIYAVGTGKITCEGVFGKDGKGQLGKILREVFKYMRIVALAFFIIFSTIDFIKAIAGSDDSQIKNATKNLTKRFILLLILLILPTLINIFLSIVEIKNGLCFLN